MAKMALRLILLGAVLYGGVEYLDSVSLRTGARGFWEAFATVLLVFAVIEIAVHPLLKFVLLPLRLISFGLVSVALSVALVYLVSLLVPVFVVTTFLDTVLLGLAFGVVRGLTR